MVLGQAGRNCFGKQTPKKAVFVSVNRRFWDCFVGSQRGLQVRLAAFATLSGNVRCNTREPIILSEIAPTLRASEDFVATNNTHQGGYR